jgi:hypothetical protein
LSTDLNYSDKEVVQTLVMVAVAVANGSSVQSVCEEKGIPTEQYFEWANRFGNIDLSHLGTVESRRPPWPKELWHEYREVFKAIIGETLITATVIFVLIVWDYLLGGISEEKRTLLDKIHYYFSLGIMIIFGGSSVLKMLILAVRSIQRLWRRN